MNDFIKEHGIEKVLEHISGKDGQPDYSNPDDFLSINVNGKPRKVFRRWLEGNGRGANSALSRMILGTQEGLSGVEKLTIPDHLEPHFNGVLFWLTFGALDMSFRGRSIKLYELAQYFGLEEMMKFIQVTGWPIKERREIVSVGNVGIVTKLVRRREGFGFILDKSTRKEIWFSAGSVVVYPTNEGVGEAGVPFGVGSECKFDIVVPRKGRKPNEQKAVNIRPLGDEPFQKIPVSDWNW